MEMKDALGTAVIEVLDKDNYRDWSVRVKTYLMAQDLWDTIETTTEPSKQEYDEAALKAWSKKNSMALHVIQISCGRETFSEIREISSAKIAWDTLAKMYKSGNVTECMDFVIDIPPNPQPALRPACCIYRVPKKLRKVNEDAYTPKLISIGPFHHGKREFADMEVEKQRYLNDFFQRETVVESRTDLDHLASIIRAKEEQIRHCYSEAFDTSSENFVKMILLDGIFIIELFLKSIERCLQKQKEKDEEKTVREKKKKKQLESDYLLSKPWLYNAVYEDLILLENQLPFFILEHLYTSTFGDSPRHIRDFLNQKYPYASGDRNKEDNLFLKLMTHAFFSENKPKSAKPKSTGWLNLPCCATDNDKAKSRKMSNISVEVKHFTDLLRYICCSAEEKPTGPVDHVYSATELDEAGLKFKPVENRGLLDITFPENKCLLYFPCFNISWLLACLPCFKCFTCLKNMERFLEVPVLGIDDSTECLFRNLMALEQCHYPSDTYICNYVSLLDYLINTKEDVGLLVDKKVIVHRLGSNKAVAIMINKLCYQIVESKSCYSVLAQDINVYRENPWNNIMASLKSVYFRDFWRGTATVVGVIVLGLTIWNFLIRRILNK